MGMSRYDESQRINVMKMGGRARVRGGPRKTRELHVFAS